MPGSTPPTSQLDWLISTTAMIVLFWSRATRDLLKSFGWGIATLHRLIQRRSCHPRRPPHSISPQEGTGFELPVRGRGQSGCRPFYAAECSGRVGAHSQFSDSTTSCIKAAWTRPPRPQSVQATHSAEFCVVREENGNAL